MRVLLFPTFADDGQSVVQLDEEPLDVVSVSGDSVFLVLTKKGLIKAFSSQDTRLMHQFRTVNSHVQAIAYLTLSDCVLTLERDDDNSDIIVPRVYQNWRCQPSTQVARAVGIGFAANGPRHPTPKDSVWCLTLPLRTSVIKMAVCPFTNRVAFVTHGTITLWSLSDHQARHTAARESPRLGHRGNDSQGGDQQQTQQQQQQQQHGIQLPSSESDEEASYLQNNAFNPHAILDLDVLVDDVEMVALYGNHLAYGSEREVRVLQLNVISLPVAVASVQGAEPSDARVSEELGLPPRPPQGHNVDANHSTSSSPSPSRSPSSSAASPNIVQVDIDTLSPQTPYSYTEDNHCQDCLFDSVTGYPCNPGINLVLPGLHKTTTDTDDPTPPEFEVIGPKPDVDRGISVNSDAGYSLTSSSLLLHRQFPADTVVHTLSLLPEFAPPRPDWIPEGDAEDTFLLASTSAQRKQAIPPPPSSSSSPSQHSSSATSPSPSSTSDVFETYPRNLSPTSMRLLIATERSGFLYDISDPRLLCTYSFTEDTLCADTSSCFLYTVTDDGLQVYTLRTTSSAGEDFPGPCLIGMQTMLSLCRVSVTEDHVILLSKHTEPPSSNDDSSRSSWCLYVLRPKTTVELYREIMERASKYDTQEEHAPVLHQLALEAHSLLLGRLSMLRTRAYCQVSRKIAARYRALLNRTSADALGGVAAANLPPPSPSLSIFPPRHTTSRFSGGNSADDEHDEEEEEEDEEDETNDGADADLHSSVVSSKRGRSSGSGDVSGGGSGGSGLYATLRNEIMLDPATALALALESKNYHSLLRRTATLMGDYYFREKNYLRAALFYACSDRTLTATLRRLLPTAAHAPQSSAPRAVTLYLDNMLFSQENLDLGLVDEATDIANAILLHYSMYAPHKLASLVLDSCIHLYDQEFALSLLEQRDRDDGDVVPPSPQFPSFLEKSASQERDDSSHHNNNDNGNDSDASSSSLVVTSSSSSSSFSSLKSSVRARHAVLSPKNVFARTLLYLDCGRIEEAEKDILAFDEQILVEFCLGHPQLLYASRSSSSTPPLEHDSGKKGHENSTSDGDGTISAGDSETLGVEGGRDGAGKVRAGGSPMMERERGLVDDEISDDEQDGPNGYLSFGKMLHRCAPWTLLEVLLRLGSKMPTTAALHLLAVPDRSSRHATVAEYRAALQCYLERCIQDRVDDGVIPRKQLALRLASLYLSELVQRSRVPTNDDDRSSGPTQSAPSTSSSSSSGPSFASVHRTFHESSLIDQRFLWLDELPPFRVPPVTASAASSPPEAIPLRAMYQSPLSLKEMKTIPVYGCLPFYLAKLQGLISKTISWDVGYLTLLSRSCDTATAVAPPDEFPMGHLALLLLCLPGDNKLTRAVGLLVERCPWITIDYCQRTFQTPKEWRAMLKALLGVITNAKSSPSVTTANGSADNGATALASYDIGMYRKVYRDVLLHLASSYDPKTFLSLLPSQGNVAFFLPFIERSVYSAKAKQLEASILSDALSEESEHS